TRTVFVLIFIIAFSSTLKGQGPFDTKEERIYKFSLIWKEVNNYFAFPKTLKQVNIDSLYIHYLNQIENATSEYEYYRTLSAFMAHFKDAHTRIRPSNRPDDTPPLTTSKIGNSIVVDNVSKNLSTKIPIGCEILEIDNIPVMKYINDSVLQYISASTPEFRLEKASKELLFGKPLSTCSVTFKKINGDICTYSLNRNYYFNKEQEPMQKPTEQPAINIQFLKGDIGYVKLKSFTDVKSMDSVFNVFLPKLQRCQKLIIDLRGNRGGTDAAWENIAYHLIPDSIIQNQGEWFARKQRGYCKMYGEYDPRFKDYYQEIAMEKIFYQPYRNKVNKSEKLNQPLIILSDSYTASAAEDFLLLMKEQKRAKIVGTASAGCIGVPLFIKLSDNYSVMICAQCYINPDGTQPNELGILPDIEAQNDYNFYIKGEDKQLEVAIQELCN
ncbi:S41 family peptidase, partial [Bacteroides rodentium]